jgi:hypothetical protein
MNNSYPSFIIHHSSFNSSSTASTSTASQLTHDLQLLRHCMEWIVASATWRGEAIQVASRLFRSSPGPCPLCTFQLPHPDRQISPAYNHQSACPSLVLPLLLSLPLSPLSDIYCLENPPPPPLSPPSSSSVKVDISTTLSLNIITLSP